MLVLFLIFHLMTVCSSSPMWYMCDLCEVSWLSCLLRCPVEQFLNRKDFDSNNVYVRAYHNTEGRYKVEKMLESYMMGYTGHDVI